MEAKERHKENILCYLSSPSNAFTDRAGLARMLKITRATLYSHFTADELTAIENEALEIRRRKYARHLAAVDMGMLQKAVEDPTAAKLVYMRFEGWNPSEKRVVEGGKNPIGIAAGVSPAVAEMLEQIKRGIQNAEDTDTPGGL